MVTKRLRDGRKAKAAEGRKAVGDYGYGYGYRGTGNGPGSVTPGRIRPSRPHVTLGTLKR